MRSLHYIVVLLALTLSGCASVDLAETPSETERAVPTVADVKPSHPYADIPGEHLATLLQAEFAIRARDLDAGLTHLMAASQAIPDPSIARRALQLAQYIRNPDAILEMAMRVSNLDPSDGNAAAFPSLGSRLDTRIAISSIASGLRMYCASCNARRAIDGSGIA